ncbi:MAG: DinB family protein [Bacteroidetes bacterium]|nr:DinB family protein [Bacteroidota bacterium]MBK9672723.1 DinB family protein [Bacteroidota bacterium]MBP6414508.1 DinB family protein [Bacteroidia bacterium]
MKNNHLFEETKAVLMQLIESLNKLNYDEYTHKIEPLNNSSIGEHVRHITELFQQLEIGYNSGVLNYDERKRDVRIQQNLDFAIESIAKIIESVTKENKKIQLITLLSANENQIETNYYRELMYNLEHCIHHQALLKIGFQYLGIDEIPDDYGVAKSTLAYRKQCAQ